MTGFRGPPGFVGRQGVKGKQLPMILCSHNTKLTPHSTTTTYICSNNTAYIPAATSDCVGVFDPQDRKETRVRRETEDFKVSWDPKEAEASKVSDRTETVIGYLHVLVQAGFQFQLLTWFLLS